ncbi:hypothetical protein [Streptomyces sp. NPDC058202]|uniref:hypothetical protein n=1 Tax=Streptomyces sp. NPDC058202 TaxID=3346380 RepID=UPI0036E3E5D2
MTEDLALLIVQGSAQGKKYPPMDDPCIEVRPVDVHQDSAGYVHPDVEGRDFYLLEYIVDLAAMTKRMPCPPTS